MMSDLSLHFKSTKSTAVDERRDGTFVPKSQYCNVKEYKVDQDVLI